MAAINDLLSFKVGLITYVFNRINQDFDISRPSTMLDPFVMDLVLVLLIKKVVLTFTNVSINIVFFTQVPQSRSQFSSPYA